MCHTSYLFIWKWIPSYSVHIVKAIKILPNIFVVGGEMTFRTEPRDAELTYTPPALFIFLDSLPKLPGWPWTCSPVASASQSGWDYRQVCHHVRQENKQSPEIINLVPQQLVKTGFSYHCKTYIILMEKLISNTTLALIWVLLNVKPHGIAITFIADPWSC